MFDTDQIPPNLHFASSLAKKKKKKENTKKTKNINPLSWEKRLHLAYATSLLNP
jgi:arginine exporter protein ArgO